MCLPNKVVNPGVLIQPNLIISDRFPLATLTSPPPHPTAATNVYFIPPNQIMMTSKPNIQTDRPELMGWRYSMSHLQHDRPNCLIPQLSIVSLDRNGLLKFPQRFFFLFAPDYFHQRFCRSELFILIL